MQTGPSLDRRQALAVAAACIAVPMAARAEPWLRRYVVLYCDPTLRPVLRQLGDRFGASRDAPVTIFAAPPTQALALLAHGTQDDLLITTEASGAKAEAQGLASKTGPLGWRNRLVVAASRADPEALATLDPAAVLRRLGDGRFALTDPTPVATIDGPAILARLGLDKALAGRITPAASTDEIGFLIRTGAARLGLCHRTDIRADGGLTEIAALPDGAYDPIRYTLSRTVHAWSANMEDFARWLGSEQSQMLLRAQGLEVT